MEQFLGPRLIFVWLQEDSFLLFYPPVLTCKLANIWLRLYCHEILKSPTNCISTSTVLERDLDLNFSMLHCKWSQFLWKRLGVICFTVCFSFQAKIGSRALELQWGDSKLLSDHPFLGAQCPVEGWGSSLRSSWLDLSFLAWNYASWARARAARSPWFLTCCLQGRASIPQWGLGGRREPLLPDGTHLGLSLSNR